MQQHIKEWRTFLKILQLPSGKPEGLIQAVNKPLQKLYKLRYMLKTQSKQVSTLQKHTWFVNE